MWLLSLCHKDRGEQQKFSNLCDNQQLFIHPPQQSLDEPLPFP